MSGKLDKLKEIIDQAEQVQRIGKVIAPPKVGKIIDKVEQGEEIAKVGLSMFERIKAMFKKKK